MDIVTKACEALEETLKTIKVDNHYLTNLGDNVIQEFAGILIANKQQTPFVAIQPESTGALQKSTKCSKFENNLQLVLVVDAFIGASKELNQGLADLRKCLHHKPFERALGGQIPSLEVGSSTYDITDDSRYALAVMPVTLTLIETYED